MRRPANHAALTDEVARFQAEVRRLALATVAEVVKQELERKLAERPPARARARAPGRTDTAAAPAARSRKQPVTAATRARDQTTPAGAPGEQMTLPIDRPVDATATTAGPQQPSTPAAPGSRKRVPWTREAIINELATWMLSGTAIDATFVQRYGPPGLVAAARRVFGRFDAALNVAGLHISKLYPDGPPQRGQP